MISSAELLSQTAARSNNIFRCVFFFHVTSFGVDMRWLIGVDAHIRQYHIHER